MAHVRWEKSGEALVTSAEDDRVELVSTMPSAPGSRPAGVLKSGTKVRVKVPRCRRRGASEEPLLGEPGGVTYVIEGRLIDASRSVRDEIAALATNAAAPHNGSPKVDDGDPREQDALNPRISEG